MPHGNSGVSAFFLAVGLSVAVVSLVGSVPLGAKLLRDWLFVSFVDSA